MPEPFDFTDPYDMSRLLAALFRQKKIVDPDGALRDQLVRAVSAALVARYGMLALDEFARFRAEMHRIYTEVIAEAEQIDEASASSTSALSNQSTMSTPPAAPSVN